MEDIGEFRQINVTAMNSNVMYAPHTTIGLRLQSLLLFVKHTLLKTPDNVREAMEFMIKLGAFFFSEFLLIHPFRNGNGRTARLLLNLFLQDILIVPFSLYIDTRDRYIHVLESRSDCSPPNDLATYLLLACNRTASQILWICLGLADEDEEGEKDADMDD